MEGGCPCTPPLHKEMAHGRQHACVWQHAPRLPLNSFHACVSPLVIMCAHMNGSISTGRRPWHVLSVRCKVGHHHDDTILNPSVLATAQDCQRFSSLPCDLPPCILWAVLPPVPPLLRCPARPADAPSPHPPPPPAPTLERPLGSGTHPQRRGSPDPPGPPLLRIRLRT